MQPIKRLDCELTLFAEDDEDVDVVDDVDTWTLGRCGLYG